MVASLATTAAMTTATRGRSKYSNAQLLADDPRLERHQVGRRDPFNRERNPRVFVERCGVRLHSRIDVRWRRGSLAPRYSLTYRPPRPAWM
jgi:hypothetical protein